MSALEETKIRISRRSREREREKRKIFYLERK